MTLRHKLADWISGGELTRLGARVHSVGGKLLRCQAALTQIERIGYDAAGHDATRMAAIAREALE